jgi:pentatricopeptide repeat protein
MTYTPQDFESSFYYRSILIDPFQWKNIYYWNKAFGNCTNYNQALNWLNYIKIMNVVKPNTNSYNQVLMKTENVEQAIDLLHEMKDTGIKEDAWTATIIINMWTRNFVCAWEIYKDINCKPSKALFIALLNKVSNNEELNILLSVFNNISKDPMRYKLENWREKTLERLVLEKSSCK